MMNARGMTLIELIAVTLLIAIVSVVILTRTMDIPAVSATASEATVRAHLLYAQAMAMKQNKYLWGIKCDGSRYWLFRTEAQDDDSTDPADQDTALYLPGEEETRLSAEGMSAFTIYYDAYGRPRRYSSTDGKTEILSDPLTINLESESIRVNPETGFLS